MDNKKTVSQIAEMFGVSAMGVRYWIKKGLPYTKEKVIGIKRRMVINPDDVYDFLELDKQRGIKNG